jgi:hypothetical protein
MINPTLNTIGLVLAITGVVLIFFYGPPMPDLRTEVHIVTEQGLPPAERAQVTERLLKHQVYPKLGLGLILMGFLFQLGATWIRS